MSDKSNKISNKPSVIIHGGAGSYSPEYSHLKVPVLKAALDQAWCLIKAGADSLEVAVEAVAVLENSEYFNAGYGGYPNADGIVLLDVGVMTGTRRYVSLINVRRARFPSRIAKDMLDDFDTLLSTWTYELEQELDGAKPELKKRYGIVDKHQDLLAPFVIELLEDRGEELSSLPNGNLAQGTVGCVARDLKGELAAVTSTGGTSLKANGRVGDSPIIGAGVFADQEIGAFSATGHGEAFLKSAFGGVLLSEMRNKLRADPLVFDKQPEMLKALIAEQLGEVSRKTLGASGGAIVCPPLGPPCYESNSEMLSLAMQYCLPSGEEVKKVGLELKNGEFIN